MSLFKSNTIDHKRLVPKIVLSNLTAFLFAWFWQFLPILLYALYARFISKKILFENLRQQESKLLQRLAYRRLLNLQPLQIWKFWLVRFLLAPSGYNFLLILTVWFPVFMSILSHTIIIFSSMPWAYCHTSLWIVFQYRCLRSFYNLSSRASQDLFSSLLQS